MPIDWGAIDEEYDKANKTSPIDIPAHNRPATTTGVPGPIDSAMVGMVSDPESRMNKVKALFPDLVEGKDIFADPETGQSITVRKKNGQVITFEPPDEGHAFATLVHRLVPTASDVESVGSNDLAHKATNANLAAASPDLALHMGAGLAAGPGGWLANALRLAAAGAGGSVVKDLIAKATPGGSEATPVDVGINAANEGATNAMFGMIPHAVRAGGLQLAAKLGSKEARELLAMEATGTAPRGGKYQSPAGRTTAAINSHPEVAALVQERAAAYASKNMDRVHEIDAQLQDWAATPSPNVEGAVRAGNIADNAPPTPPSSGPPSEEQIALKEGLKRAEDIRAKETMLKEEKTNPGAFGANQRATRPAQEPTETTTAQQLKINKDEATRSIFQMLKDKNAIRARAAQAALQGIPGTKILLPASHGLGNLSPKASAAVSETLAASPAARSVEAELASRSRDALNQAVSDTAIKPEVEAQTRNAAEAASNKSAQRVQAAKQGVGKAEENLSGATREANLNDKELQAIARSNVLDKTEAARAANAQNAEKLTPSVLRKEKEAQDELFRAKVDLARHKNDIPTAEHGLDAEREAVRIARGDLNAAQNQKLLTSQKNARELGLMEGKNFDAVKAEQAIASGSKEGIAAQRTRVATTEKLGEYTPETVRTLLRDKTPESQRLVRINDFARELNLAQEKTKAATPDSGFLKLAFRYGKRATIIGAIPDIVRHIPKQQLRNIMEDPKALSSMYDSLEKGISAQTLAKRLSGAAAATGKVNRSE